jgi:hypothetical protein
MVKPGYYRATILNHAISETKNGDPQAAVTFSFEAEGKSHTMTWFGSFKEGKAQEITIKALLVCGLKGNNPAGDLDIGREVSITVEDEVGQDGKTRSRIRWVNPLGGVKNVIAADAAKAKLEALQGAVMAARGENNIPDTDDEIPF